VSVVAATRGWAEPPPSPGAPAAHTARRPAELDEQTLVVRAQEGDARSFEVLARRHEAALYRLAVRLLGDPAEAEDALQEALLDAWRRIGGFRAESTFSTWMYRVVTNRCMGMLRNRRPLPVERVDELGVTAVVAGSPERTAEVDAGMVALGQALAGLRDELRVCWVLRELEGLGYTDIAHITGASEDAVRGRIHRARVQLAEVMRPWR
jgi:RNA polymerase sigma-70 factor, ECF subfamily